MLGVEHKGIGQCSPGQGFKSFTLGEDSLRPEAVLGPAGCLAASLASSHSMPTSLCQL